MLLIKPDPGYSFKYPSSFEVFSDFEVWVTPSSSVCVCALEVSMTPDYLRKE
jgi:hypothetical protein